jgi:hypothetical protein
MNEQPPISAKTSDGVYVTNGTEVYWQYDPEGLPFIPISNVSAVRVSGGASEPMSEMFSTRPLAREWYRSQSH